MRIRSVVAVAAILITGVAACGGGGGSTSATGGAGGEQGPPVKGGTLKVIGSSDVANLDPAISYEAITGNLARTWTRQLVTYPPSGDPARATQIVPDVADALPTVSGDGKTYTFTIRQGVMWNTSPPRQVTAQDFVRGLKRIANPYKPSGGISYYTSTILGYQDYFDRAQKAGKTAAAIAAFQNSTDIPGIKAVDDKTLRITLKAPANDFLNILAMNFASPAPVEYDKYVPDSAEFRQHTISLGPYQLQTYNAGRSMLFVKNPAWAEASDPIRKQYVDQIQITFGQDSPDAVQQQLEAGTADLSWDQPVPTSAIPRLEGNDQFAIFPQSNLNPYIVFNLLSPNNAKALTDLKVRQAINYAINKTAIAQIYGGTKIATVLNGTVPKGSAGFDESVQPYATAGGQGDPAKCKALLAQAGVAGLTLNFPYRTSGNHPKVAQSVAADLTKCGIQTKLIATQVSEFYGNYIQTVAKTKAGAWDIAGPGWGPDWLGNNGRTMIQPLFDGRNYADGSTNYGDYNNPEVNALIDQAIAAKTATEAEPIWRQANARIMADAPIAPMVSINWPIFRAGRVKGATFNWIGQGYDYTTLWLQ